MESFHSIVIIGAGLSGLYAAQLLKETFPDLLVIEAQNRIGGRIKQVHGLAPWPLEAGAEFVHGRDSLFVRFAEQQVGASFTEKEWPDWWYFGKQVGGQGLVEDKDVDDEVDKVHDLFGDCGDEPHPPPGKDLSAAEWMAAKGCTPRQMAVADAVYANDFACSLRQLGVRETIEENRLWDSGETYLLMDRSMSSVIQHLSKGLNVKMNWVVDSVYYGTDNGVAIRSTDGRVVRCKAVLVTVPLTVLQKGDITFYPPLPAAKTTAMSRIKMGNCIKVILSFSRQFWPDNQYDVVCPGAFAPEFWMLKRTVTDPTAGTPHIMVGFFAGDRAAEVSAMDPQEAQRRFLEQLDEVYGTPADPRPASRSLVRGQVYDWSKEPFIGGSYTYPSLGAELGDRAALGAPVASRLFFAGEATNEAINPCLQGVMHTAGRAAAEITAALGADGASAAAAAPVVLSKL